ncbi:putative WRKY transcription factor 53, partial [Bienertia sinuspersici]
KSCRGYYRCTHRHTKGCVATKQVQRSDDDPSIYHILYRGEHTCTQGALQVQDQFDPIHQAQMKSEPLPSPSPQDQEVYVGLGPEGELKVEPEEQAENWAQLLRSFSYSSACLDPEPINNLYFTPAFGSPTISGSNYFPLSSYRPTGPHFGLTVQTPEIDNNEAVSGQNSVTYSPIINDFEFPIDETHDIGIYFS